ncbi:MAG: KEOPS complex subunit Pcc1 [Ignisphaera sp.]|nr:KEOPS complex subunit Pcc1 [Ignisphaera sp.]MCX8168360.1 KEOPS complex subunit Pcc1 [Ignisphaera sp.]MDW8086200.1 KEOPS complex subunit Pcc1 [Ignisphaera sp.]
MKYEVAIEIPFNNADLCPSVLNAIKPDNITAPSGVEIEMKCYIDRLRIVVKGFNVGVLTIRNTIDDIFIHLLSAYKVLELLVKNG